MSRNNRRNRRANGQRGRAAIETDGHYHFTINGKTYRLISMKSAHERLPAGDILDAAMEPDENRSGLRFFALILAAASPDPATLSVLRSLPINRFMSIMEDWQQASGVVMPGESENSSS